MRVRDRVGLNLSPLFLRIMLGTILLWMGLGKILGTFEVDTTAAADLANMGVITPGAAPTAPPAAPTPGPTPAPTAPERGKDGARAPGGDGNVRLVAQTGGGATPKYTAADFPTPVKVRTLYMIAIAVKHAAEPGATKSGSQKMTTWPSALAGGAWPVYVAWTAAIVETLSGVGLILGLLTRVWALLIAVRMVGAIWLTQVGPAIASGDAVLGFLPPHEAFDVEKWRQLLVQFCLLMSALALLFLGPGRASLDNAIFAPSRPDDDDGE